MKETIKIPSVSDIQQIKDTVAKLRKMREQGLKDAEMLRVKNNELRHDEELGGGNPMPIKMSLVEDGQWNKLDEIISNIMALPNRNAFKEINEQMTLEIVEKSINSTGELVTQYKQELTKLQDGFVEDNSKVQQPLAQCSVQLLVMLSVFTKKLVECDDKIKDTKTAEENPQSEEPEKTPGGNINIVPKIRDEKLPLLFQPKKDQTPEDVQQEPGCFEVFKSCFK